MENVYLQTERIKNNHYTQNHFQELYDKKNVNTKSMIIGNSPMKKRKLKNNDNNINNNNNDGNNKRYIKQPCMNIEKSQKEGLQIS